MQTEGISSPWEGQQVLHGQGTTGAVLQQSFPSISSVARDTFLLCFQVFWDFWSPSVLGGAGDAVWEGGAVWISSSGSELEVPGCSGLNLGGEKGSFPVQSK